MFSRFILGADESQLVMKLQQRNIYYQKPGIRRIHSSHSQYENNKKNVPSQERYAVFPIFLCSSDLLFQCQCRFKSSPSIVIFSSLCVCYPGSVCVCVLVILVEISKAHQFQEGSLCDADDWKRWMPLLPPLHGTRILVRQSTLFKPICRLQKKNILDIIADKINIITVQYFFLFLYITVYLQYWLSSNRAD